VPGIASKKARNVPDVALDADPNTPYALYFDGTFAISTGGTSAVAPNLAAMQAQFDQYYGHRLGLAQTGLYNGFRVGSYPGKTWHDILSGSNGGYSAHAGYDNVTGVGSLDATRYMLQIPQAANSRRR
jgi:kumamolisin